MYVGVKYVSLRKSFPIWGKETLMSIESTWYSGLPKALQDKAKALGNKADGFTQVGDNYIFTKNGKSIDSKGYDASGKEVSIFGSTAAGSSQASPRVDQSSIQQQIAQNANIGGLLNGGGTFNAGNDFNTSWMNMGGGFDIDSNKLMQSAGIMGAVTSIASMVPWGLGGLLSGGALQSAMASFMNSVSFNFDFSNLIASASGNNRGNGTVVETPSDNAGGKVTSPGDDSEGAGAAGGSASQAGGASSQSGRVSQSGGAGSQAGRVSQSGGTGSSTRARTRTGNSPSGWTRDTSGKYKNMTPEQIAKTFSGLNADEQKALAGYIKEKNPSVFGSKKDYSKLDVPSQAWVDANIKGKVKATSKPSAGSSAKPSTKANPKTIDKFFNPSSLIKFADMAASGLTLDSLCSSVDNSNGKYIKEIVNDKDGGTIVNVRVNDGKTHGVQSRRFMFDKQGRFTQCINSSEEFVRASYDSKGKLASVTARRGTHGGERLIRKYTSGVHTSSVRYERSTWSGTEKKVSEQEFNQPYGKSGRPVSPYKGKFPANAQRLKPGSKESFDDGTYIWTKLNTGGYQTVKKSDGQICRCDKDGNITYVKDKNGKQISYGAKSYSTSINY